MTTRKNPPSLSLSSTTNTASSSAAAINNNNNNNNNRKDERGDSFGLVSQVSLNRRMGLNPFVQGKDDETYKYWNQAHSFINSLHSHK